MKEVFFFQKISIYSIPNSRIFNFMEPPKFTSQCKAHQCSLCKDDTEFNCETCKLHLCFHCKERHVVDLNSKYHRVIIYRERFRFIQKHDECTRHPGMVYNRYCELCDLPLCSNCTGHRKHKIQNIKTTFKTKRQHHKKFIDRIGSDILYSRRILLEDCKVDFENFPIERSRCQSNIFTKAGRLKGCIGYAMDYLSKKHKCKLIQELGKKQMIMKIHLAYLQHYEHIYEQSATNPVQCVSLIKKECFPKINDSPTLSRHSQILLTGPINKGHLIKLLCDIQISEKGKRHSDYRRMFKPLSVPEVINPFKIKDVEKLTHISCVTPDRVWVSDLDSLLLTDKSGAYLHELTELSDQSLCGIFSVNSENELIYIDINFNIKKLSNDLQKNIIFIARADDTIDPVSLYCSRSTGDVLVGKWLFDIRRRQFLSKISRYNHLGQLTQTILDNGDHKFLHRPGYITENNNGDILVTDSLTSGSVVAIGRGGNHRFTYRGHPGALLHPFGVCTDAFSHILLSDINSGSIHMLDENGQFLTYLLISAESFGPFTLCYDVNTHFLWVGTGNNNLICAFKYTDLQDVVTGKFAWYK